MIATKARQQQQQQQQEEEAQFEASQNMPYMDDRTPDSTSIAESMMDEDPYGGQYSHARKRKRDEEQQSMMIDQEHQIWADALLDYFMLADSEDRFPSAPLPPPGINLDKPIDDKGHTALHWAAAMGDVDVVKDLLERGARMDSLSNNLETPLMRAVMFTNNSDKGTMVRMIRLLQSSVVKTDWFGCTVFHHIAATTSSKNKYLSARYYMESIINSLAETWVSDEITRLLNFQDHNGDTTIHIAARNGARKCVRSLLGRNVAVDIPNKNHETADDMIRLLNERRRQHGGNRREASSSPFGPDRIPMNGIDPDLATAGASGLSMLAPAVPSYHSQTANGLMNRVAPQFMAKCRALASAYETEFEEKETEATENEQVVRKRLAEIEALKRQSLEAQAQLDALQADLGADNAEAEREREEADFERLQAEAISLLELEQRDSLRHMASKNPPPVPQWHQPQNSQQVNGVSPEEMERRTGCASNLQRVQDERKRLTTEIVRSMAVAGLGERHAEYKRLIHGALGVKEEEVESVLDEILGQLEEDKREKMVAMEEVS